MQGRRPDKRGAGTGSSSLCCARSSCHPPPSPPGLHQRTWLHMLRIGFFVGWLITIKLYHQFSCIFQRPNSLADHYSCSFSVLAVTCCQFTVGELLSPQLPRPPTHGHARPQQLESLDLSWLLRFSRLPLSLVRVETMTLAAMNEEERKLEQKLNISKE